MGDLELLVLQPGPLPGHPQLEVADGRKFAAEADRHQELCPYLPLLEFAAEERGVGVGAEERVESAGVVGLVVLIDEVLAHAEEAVGAQQVEPGQDQVFRGDQFELPLLDTPLLAAEFGRA